VATVTIARRRSLNYPQAHDVGRRSNSGGLAKLEAEEIQGTRIIAKTPLAPGKRE
jgi:hypothetical protein